MEIEVEDVGTLIGGILTFSAIANLIWEPITLLGTFIGFCVAIYLIAHRKRNIPL
jgi:hypothetical protein